MLETVAIGHVIDKETYDAAVPALREALLEAQYDLMKAGNFSTVIVLSSTGTAGKGDTIRQLLGWMDPRTIESHALGIEESDEQRLHPFMWRYWQCLPPKGRIGIFFDHWYTAPISGRLRGTVDRDEFERRLAEINRFERMLTDEGTLLLKFYLHITRKHQKKRIKKLTADPMSRWRVSSDDLMVLKNHDAVVELAEDVFRLTSHGHAPWTVIEADDRRYRDLSVGRTVHQAIMERLRVEGASPQARKSRQSAAPAGGLDGRTVLSTLDYTKTLDEPEYRKELDALQNRLALLVRDKRFRERSLVLAFEGTDAAGKGGAIRRVTQALDVRFCRTVPIAKPTDEEAARPYLWRFWRHVPRQGHATIYDRSWYGRVLVERVEGFCPESAWRRAYGEINDFEADLVGSGVILVKFWLAITKDEQLRRFEERERLPFKHYKITPEDWRNRERWADYEQAVSDMVTQTSTNLAPWTLIEAEDKKYSRIKVLRTLCRHLEDRL